MVVGYSKTFPNAATWWVDWCRY